MAFTRTIRRVSMPAEIRLPGDIGLELPPDAPLQKFLIPVGKDNCRANVLPV